MEATFEGKTAFVTGAAETIVERAASPVFPPGAEVGSGELQIFEGPVRVACLEMTSPGCALEDRRTVI